MLCYEKTRFPAENPGLSRGGGGVAKMAMSPGPEADEDLLGSVETDEPAILGEIERLGGILFGRREPGRLSLFGTASRNFRSIAVFLTPHYNESKLGQIAIPRRFAKSFVVPALAGLQRGFSANNFAVLLIAIPGDLTVK
jgi:hypothetical protein